MTTWQVVGLLVLAVILAPVAAVLLAAAGGWLIGRRRARCPSCGGRSLRCVQSIRATILVDGRRAPDSWSYYLCESCGARYKQHHGVDFVLASEAEWAQYCTGKT